MSSFRRRLLACATLAACACVFVPAQAGTASAASGAGGEAALLRRLLHSRELWATIDVCNPPDQRDDVGIRGSMPGDRQAHDKMYMSFRLQYMEPATKRWIDLAAGSKPPFVYVGPAGSVRQGGRSFQLVPHSGKSPFELRGVVDYQWRRGSRVIQSTSRVTETGHRSLAGADPADYSAATCRLG